MGNPPESSGGGSAPYGFARGLIESIIASLVVSLVVTPSPAEGPLWAVIRTAISLWILVGLPLFLLCTRAKCRGHFEIWL